ncbi:MAG: hypothetical protein AAGA90_09745 [Actinomycetota bacterium]
MRRICRILAVLAAAFVLTAGACDPTKTELTDEGIVDSSTGELIDLDDPPDHSDDPSALEDDFDDGLDALEGCGGSTPFADTGTGPATIVTPLYVNVNGVAQLYPDPVPDGCADFTGATVTDGFFGQWDPNAGQGRSTTLVDLPGQINDAWATAP